VWIWGRGSEYYPKWAVHVCQAQTALHVRGARGAAAVGNDAMLDDAAAEEGGGGEGEDEAFYGGVESEEMASNPEEGHSGIVESGWAGKGHLLQQDDGTMSQQVTNYVSCAVEGADGQIEGEAHGSVTGARVCTCQWCRQPSQPGEEASEEGRARRLAEDGSEEAEAPREQEEETLARQEGVENTLWIVGGWRGGRVPPRCAGVRCNSWGPERWSRIATEIQGQWCVSNASCGSLTSVALRYHTLGEQAIFDVNSGPWVLQECDVRGNNVVCVEVSNEGMLCAKDCVFGGTGPRLDVVPGRKGVAHVGVNALMNANVTLRRCVLQDIGLSDGVGIHAAQASTVSVEACVLRRCSIAIYMAHFAHVRVRGCLIADHKHSALFSECYQEIPAPLLPSWNTTEYNDFEPASSHPSLRAQRAGLDPPPPDAAAAAAHGEEWLPFGLPEKATQGQGRRCGSLWVSRTHVRGHVWHTDSRPWRFYCDDPILQ